MDKQYALRHCGNIAQLAGIREFTIENGKARGARAYEVHNAAGLRFTVVADNCLDVFDMSFEGVNFSYMTKNGLVGGAHFEMTGDQFMYGFSGGMMRTCGLSNAGPSCDDNGAWRTMHGRIGATPAENVSAKAYWKDGEYYLEIAGDVCETRLFGYDLALHRTVSTTLYGNEVVVHDTLENRQPRAEEFMLLYHCNFGYPLLDEGARLVTSNTDVQPRTDYAAQDMRYTEMDAPEDDLDERCYFLKSTPTGCGFATAALVNDKLGKAGYVRYDPKNLPLMIEWKSMVSHDYVLGLEPSNSYINGRVGERENGTLPTIDAFGTLEFEVRLGARSGKKDIDELVKLIKG